MLCLSGKIICIDNYCYAYKCSWGWTCSMILTQPVKNRNTSILSTNVHRSHSNLQETPTIDVLIHVWALHHTSVGAVGLTSYISINDLTTSMWLPLIAKWRGCLPSWIMVAVKFNVINSNIVLTEASACGSTPWLSTSSQRSTLNPVIQAKWIGCHSNYENKHRKLINTTF